MRFSATIDEFIDEQARQGRITSPRTERDYRTTLLWHEEDVQGFDPRYTDRDDVRKTLRRWRNPNTQSRNRSILVSFYDWLVEEGHRPYNPARQTPRPKRKRAQVYRLTREEGTRVLANVQGERQRRVAYLGLCAGLRRNEILGLQGRHFRTPGLVWISADIAKGGRARGVPVIAELQPIWQRIHESVDLDEYVLPAQRWRDPGVNREMRDYARRPSSEQSIWRLVRILGKQASLPVPLKPHMLRHCFADHIARYAGMRNAQFLLGHATISTTEEYLGTPTAEELAAAIKGFAFAADESSANTGQSDPKVAEPVQRLSRVLERLWLSGDLRSLARSMA